MCEMWYGHLEGLSASRLLRGERAACCEQQLTFMEVFSRLAVLYKGRYSPIIIDFVVCFGA